MEIIEKYTEEVEKDTHLDAINVTEMQMRIPGIKHKWVARLINHKIELSKLRGLLKAAKEQIIEKQRSNEKVTLSNVALEKFTENNDTVKRLKSKIEIEEITILYLEKIERIFHNMSFDIKNLTELMKLEQL